MGHLTLFICLTCISIVTLIINNYLTVIMFVEVPILQPVISLISSSVKKMKALPQSVFMALPAPPPNKGIAVK